MKIDFKSTILLVGKRLRMMLFLVALGSANTVLAQEFFQSSSVYFVNSYTKLPEDRELTNDRYFRHFNYKHSIMIEGSRNSQYLDLSVILGYTFLKMRYFQVGAAAKFYPLPFFGNRTERRLISPYIRGEYQQFIIDTRAGGGFIASRYYHEFSIGTGIQLMFDNRYSINFEGILFGFNDIRVGVGRRF